MLGCTHRHLTSPVMRATVLAMSGTRQKYHYPSVLVVAFDLAKRSFPYSKNRSDHSCFTSYCFDIVMAHCMVLLFPFGQNRVTYLYCLYVVFKVHWRERKNPSLISRKNVPFNNQFWKFCAIYFDFFQNPLLRLLVAVVLPNFCFWVCSFNTNERDKKTLHISGHLEGILWPVFQNFLKFVTFV